MESPDCIQGELVYIPVLNFAMQQNRVPVIRHLTLTNRTDQFLQNLTLNLTAEPEFGTAHTLQIDTLAPGERLQLDTLQLQLSAAYFAQLTERMAGSLKLQITFGDKTLFTQLYPIDILAYDQWGGMTILPEMVSAFITPNHPAIAPILKRTALILEQWTGNPSLNEYQSRNPDRVQKQMAALYTALAEQHIIYNSVPPSFETSGQRIRLVDAVLTQKLANCLDMALLYASCLEAMGIHALVVFTQGHAFAGAWLVPETFPDMIIDDPSFLSKRTAEGIHDISLVETTCMQFGSTADFDKAVQMAQSQMLKTNEFMMAVDIRRSRFSGIRPLPQRIQKGGFWEIEEEDTHHDKSQSVPQSIHPYDLSGLNNSIEATKQLLWERKLLDLSLRNNLLNIRITKNTIQLLPTELDRFEDALADGNEFMLVHKPEDWECPPVEFGIYRSISPSDPVLELIQSDINQQRIRSYLTENELQNALTHLYRTSRSAMEENGANTLYIALGLLRWYETPESERPRYAPILLLPVEMIRKSAAKGYVIRSREEETMMNITLLEMLRQNFGINISGLETLPADEKGVNVKLVYSLIRKAIQDQKKWDVEEQAIMGIFSFSTFIMWNDIHHNASKLSENPIVSSLINGKIAWDAEESVTDAFELDKQLSPSDILLPISADSSQLEAIYEAVNEKSFILHGPPGTGKSQTITNIIANALYKGKRVLFVAEKMAALSVVQNRLAAIGLAPFCLELHSNKTKKSSVLSQLKASCEAIKISEPENYILESERLLKLRTELNIYIEALHKRYPFGLSLYDAIIRHQSLPNEESILFPIALLDLIPPEKIQEWEEAIEILVSTGKACGHPFNHPLEGIEISGYSSALKEEGMQQLKQLEEQLTLLKNKVPLIPVLLGETLSSHTKKQSEIIPLLINKLLCIPELTATLISQPQIHELIDELIELVIHGKERNRIQSEITSIYSGDVLLINAKQALMDWNHASTQWFLPKFFGQRRVAKSLKPYVLVPSKINTKEQLHQIIRFQEEKSFVEKYADKLPLFFGKYGRKEDWETIEQIIEDTSVIQSLIQKLSSDISQPRLIKEALAKQLSDGIEFFKNQHYAALSELYSLLQNLSVCENHLFQTLGITQEVLYGNSVQWIEDALAKINIWKDHLNLLKDWYQWLKVNERLSQSGIGFVADTYKNKNVPTDQVQNRFYKGLYRSCIAYILSKEPKLELFKGKLFNDTIEKYKRLFLYFTELTQKELYSHLASHIPSFTREAAQNSEVGILQKNIKNNARGIPIRKLFDQIPTLLSRMCPCMLMSPISVAQYVDAYAEPFDLIIFDEASQMPTYEAVGALARGKHMVIVGDPKQMPPTRFFSANQTDEEHIEMEDLESILDDCLALSMPSKHLLWHYRSKHESLIAFSNSEYYNNQLLTFPSPDHIESKVKLISVQGVYDKGKSRQNKAEAQAVIDEICRRLLDKDLQKKSIGVVTFSSVQQNLIEDLLSSLFITHPELEKKALECEEPLFIKNLENVQGDERDIILFSVGYGPDAGGRVSMNFGPLNRQGGERRLNVAVSRARYEMLIFSTLRSDQIDLNRTSAIGVAGLKRFLEYAEKGERIIQQNQSVNPSTLSIEQIIADRLKQSGYTIHTHIGCSGYKIDIGIVDDENPSQYKLGILCDGENYKRTKTARDREIVQTQVLRQLGWKIHRIWTLDWLENPEEVLQSILDALKEAGKKNIREENQLKSPQIHVQEPAAGMVKPHTADKKSIYQTAIVKTGLAEDFFHPESKRLLINQIRTIIETEAPVSRTVFYKRILNAWGITRLGPRIDTYLDTLIKEQPLHIITHENLSFFWKDKEQYLSYTTYRPNSEREASELPPEEIANGMKQILEDEISIPVKDLYRLSGLLFGFARSGSLVDAAMQRGLQDALRKGYLKIENEKAVIV